MRIITGTARGRILAAPKGLATRPITERVRGAIFNILRDEVAGAAALDLFAGSGSLGLEALSRGAQRCVFVERDRAAADVLRRNAATLGFTDRCEVLVADAFRVRPDGPFDIVFVDPPYALAARLDEDSEMAGLVRNLFAGRLLKPAGVVVARTPKRSGPLALPSGAVLADERFYGADAVRFLRRSSQQSAISRKRPHPDAEC